MDDESETCLAKLNKFLSFYEASLIVDIAIIKNGNDYISFEIWLIGMVKHMFLSLILAQTIFSIHIKSYIDKLLNDKLLYNTTRTIPRGAKYHYYPLAFKVLLWLKLNLVIVCAQLVAH